MNKGMVIFLYVLSVIWITAGVLVILGAWNEKETDYKEVIGKVSQALELSYEPRDLHVKQQVVLAKIYLEGDTTAYRLRGKLYRMNTEGMESIEVGETLRLLVKKTTIVGGFKIGKTAKSVSVSGIYRSNGEVIIPFEKGLAHARQRLLIGIQLIVLGLIVGVWVFIKNR